MLNKRNIIPITVSIFIVTGFVLFLFYFALNYQPGSYPNVEKFEFDLGGQSIINAIEKFKKDNPQYLVPPQLQLHDKQEDYRYCMYLHYPQENEIIYFFVSGPSVNFVGVNKGLTLGNWKEVNKDFSRAENKEVINKFKERILDKLPISDSLRIYKRDE